MSVDGSVHRDEVIVTAKPIEEGAEIGEGQFPAGSASALGP
jgi:hypothetical protein